MKKYFWLLLLFHAYLADGQTVIDGHGELYVLHLPDGGGVRIVSAAAGGQVADTTFIRMPDDIVLHYFDADTTAGIDFCFTLHRDVPVRPGQPLPEKTLVVSDLHGELNAFAALLKGNAVVDNRFDWQYGANRLIFIGDILDRGRGDNGIAWLLYKLQCQAASVGGRVDFLPGNHEDLVLKNDLRYVNRAHIEFATKAGVPYHELYGPESELGRWFRRSPPIMVADDILFVHAGLSRVMADSLYSIDEMNELHALHVGIPNRERRRMEPRCHQMFGSAGALWYRGLVFDTEKHPGATSDDLDATLAYYGVGRIVVGHSEIDDVEWRYGGRVIAVNVDHAENFARNRTAGLLIENGVFYAVDYDGRKQPLPPSE